MKRNQKLTALLLSGCLVLSLTACGGTAVPPVSSTPAEPPASGTEEVPASAPVSGGNVLIAYFTADENRAVDAVTSASVTTVGGVDKGRVRAVADLIAAETGGTLFSIQTSVEYPADGGELIDFAAEEQNQNTRPELTAHIEDLDAYDTIFIG